MTWSPATGSLDLATLRRVYGSGEVTPEDVIEAVYARIEARGPDPAWITLVPREQALARARALTEAGPGPDLPLYGVPIGIKDNFDLEGLPTTMGCRVWTRLAERTTPIVRRLLDAGAIPIGTNNMDQLGLGLVGVRTDFGIPACVFDPAYISGGSTSGGGVAVAAGLVGLALGGDAAGSGRVPAALNNIVGLKPTPGLVPNSGEPTAAGMVGSHSLLTLTVADAVEATRPMIGYDPTDPFSRPEAADYQLVLEPPPATFRFAVPDDRTLTFAGDGEAERLFEAACRDLEAMGGVRVPIDFQPFLTAARMLYEGPFIAQRYANFGPFLEANPGALHPATAEILGWGKTYSAVDLFAAQYVMAGYKQRARAVFADAACIVTPTTPTTFTIAELAEDNIRRNAIMGTYTNYVNLLDLPAISVPAGFRADGLAQGLMIVGAPLADSRIAGLAHAFEQRRGRQLGATPHALPMA
jgi:allophanate hydrolase